MAFLKNDSEKNAYGKNDSRKFNLSSYDRSRLPAHRFIKKLVDNELSRKYLAVTEGVLLAALGVCVYFYFFA